MSEEDKKKKVKKVLTTSKFTLLTIQMLGLLMLVTSPIVWIWYGWSISWKIGLTGIIVMMILWFFIEIAEDVENQYNAKFEPKEKKENKFQKKMREMMEEAEQKKQLI